MCCLYSNTECSNTQPTLDDVPIAVTLCPCPSRPSLSGSVPRSASSSSVCWEALFKHLGVPSFLRLSSQHTASLCSSPTSHSSFFLPFFLLLHQNHHSQPPSLAPAPPATPTPSLMSPGLWTCSVLNHILPSKPSTPPFLTPQDLLSESRFPASLF